MAKTTKKTTKRKTTSKKTDRPYIFAELTSTNKKRVLTAARKYGSQSAYINNLISRDRRV